MDRHHRALVVIGFGIASFFLAGCSGMNGRLQKRHATENDTQFHEQWLEARWRRFSVVPENQSARSTGVQRAASQSLKSDDLDDPQRVFSFLFSCSPDEATVYPTELYYYFKVRVQERAISGNLRFTDADRGILHIGYFDEYDTSFVRTASFTVENGVHVVLADGVVNVTFDGMNRKFRLAAPSDSHRGAGLLLSDEEFVADILDESGLAMVLVWDRRVRTFRYLLNDAQGVADRLLPLPAGSANLSVGEDSRFVFLTDRENPRRHVLMGVWAQNIRLNNYFDGPFDQVPPRLSLKDMLEQAYPGLEARGGIDEHGAYLQLSGQRVAISPYVPYWSLSVLTAQVSELANSSGISDYSLWNSVVLVGSRSSTVSGRQFDAGTTLRSLLFQSEK